MMIFFLLHNIWQARNKILIQGLKIDPMQTLPSLTVKDFSPPPGPKEVEVIRLQE